MGWTERTCRRLLTRMAAKSTAKSCSVVVTAVPGISKPMGAGKPKILTRTNSMSLEVSTPAPNPTPMLASAVRRASQVIILAMCAFSMPRTLYSPSSFFLRLMRKLWV